MPLMLKILPVALLALSIVSPPAGLIGFAGIGPLADPVSAWSSSPFAGARLLEQLVLAVLVGAGLREWRKGGRLRLLAPALLFAALGLASAIAEQPAMLMQRLPELSAWDHVVAFFAGGYFSRSGTSDPIYFSLLTVEGVALAVTAERLARADRQIVPRVVRMTLAGCAGLSLLTLLRILGAALRSADFLPSLKRLLLIRWSYVPDVNAAGSLYLLVIIAGAGLMFVPGRSRSLACAALLVTGFGFWMTGSRTAFLALPLAVIALAVVAAVRQRVRLQWIAIGITAGVVATVVAVLVIYPWSSRGNASAGDATMARRIMARTALNMWRDAPIAGAGIGRFYDQSSRYGAAALLTIQGPPPNQNAHNNFLQVLAEEGVVGLAALFILLASVVVPVIRTERASPDVERRFLLAAVSAYVLTWLAGHPQLVAEAALPFWLLTGTLVATTDPPRASRWRIATVATAAVVFVTAPVRANSAIRHGDFEYVGIGVSHWFPDLDGIRYREAGAVFAVYLPADGSAVDVPLRRAPSAPEPLVLSVSLGGRALQDFTITGDGWAQLFLRLPNENRRYQLVRFAAKGVGADAAPPVVLVGKTARR